LADQMIHLPNNYTFRQRFIEALQPSISTWQCSRCLLVGLSESLTSAALLAQDTVAGADACMIIMSMIWCCLCDFTLV
jgi:hypothetical protein